MDFKEHYFEFCEFLAARGIASLALDMHGNGQSQGERFHVEICQWADDIRSALDFLSDHPATRTLKTGAFGLSSGGTAVLECAVTEPRLRALITLDATVRTVLNLSETLFLYSLLIMGWGWRLFAGKELRLSMVNIFSKYQVASDPGANRAWNSDPRIIEMWSSWPVLGARESMIVDTIKRTHKITAPTLVLHGAEDRIDPPGTARLLFDTLTCEKKIRIIPGNGHAGHIDTNRAEVMTLTADWAVRHLAGPGPEQNRHIKQEEHI